MNLTEVYNLDAPSLKIYKELRDNVVTNDNSFIADSPKVINMLLQTPVKVRSILAAKEYYEANKELVVKKDIPLLYVADKKLLEKIVGHKIHHNAMMHGVRPDDTMLEDLGDHIIMLDLLTSTENIGSIARSAAALGVDSFVLPKNGPHPYGRRALRVSMGYVSRLKTYLYDDIFHTLKILKSAGYRIFAAEAADNATPLSDIKAPCKWVLLMGHEGKGLSPEVIKACDEAVQIEMAPDVKSFNVAVAASILMYRLKN